VNAVAGELGAKNHAPRHITRAAHRAWCHKRAKKPWHRKAPAVCAPTGFAQRCAVRVCTQVCARCPMSVQHRQAGAVSWVFAHHLPLGVGVCFHTRSVCVNRQANAAHTHHRHTAGRLCGVCVCAHTTEYLIPVVHTHKHFRTNSRRSLSLLASRHTSCPPMREAMARGVTSTHTQTRHAPAGSGCSGVCVQTCTPAAASCQRVCTHTHKCVRAF